MRERVRTGFTNPHVPFLDTGCKLLISVSVYKGKDEANGRYALTDIVSSLQQSIETLSLPQNDLRQFQKAPKLRFLFKSITIFL